MGTEKSESGIALDTDGAHDEAKINALVEAYFEGFTREANKQGLCLECCMTSLGQSLLANVTFSGMVKIGAANPMTAMLLLTTISAKWCEGILSSVATGKMSSVDPNKPKT